MTSEHAELLHLSRVQLAEFPPKGTPLNAERSGESESGVLVQRGRRIALCRVHNDRDLIRRGRFAARPWRDSQWSSGETAAADHENRMPSCKRDAEVFVSYPPNLPDFGLSWAKDSLEDAPNQCVTPFRRRFAACRSLSQVPPRQSSVREREATNQSHANRGSIVRSGPSMSPPGMRQLP